MWIYIPPDVEENGGLCSCNVNWCERLIPGSSLTYVNIRSEIL